MSFCDVLQSDMYLLRLFLIKMLKSEGFFFGESVLLKNNTYLDMNHQRFYLVSLLKYNTMSVN